MVLDIQNHTNGWHYAKTGLTSSWWCCGGYAAEISTKHYVLVWLAVCGSSASSQPAIFYYPSILFLSDGGAGLDLDKTCTKHQDTTSREILAALMESGWKLGNMRWYWWWWWCGGYQLNCIVMFIPATITSSCSLRISLNMCGRCGDDNSGINNRQTDRQTHYTQMRGKQWMNTTQDLNIKSPLNSKFYTQDIVKLNLRVIQNCWKNALLPPFIIWVFSFKFMKSCTCQINYLRSDWCHKPRTYVK